ncbi:MAG: hypothetical protein ABUL72_01130 [Armatimonadota bacterium]
MNLAVNVVWRDHKKAFVAGGYDRAQFAGEARALIRKFRASVDAKIANL